MYRIDSVLIIKLFNNVSKEVVDKSSDKIRSQNFSQLREPIYVQVVDLVADLVFHQLIDPLDDQLFDLQKDQHNG
jgi:hypothetical protein